MFWSGSNYFFLHQCLHCLRFRFSWILGFCPICPKTLHNTSWSFVADRACQLDVRTQWEVWREVSPQREVPADWRVSLFSSVCFHLRSETLEEKPPWVMLQKYSLSGSKSSLNGCNGIICDWSSHDGTDESGEQVDQMATQVTMMSQDCWLDK